MKLAHVNKRIIEMSYTKSNQNLSKNSKDNMYGFTYVIKSQLTN